MNFYTKLKFDPLNINFTTLSLPLWVKHFYFDTRFYVVLFCELSGENKIRERKIVERMVFVFLKMCHLEWDIPKRKTIHLAWDGWSIICLGFPTINYSGKLFIFCVLLIRAWHENNRKIKLKGKKLKHKKDSLLSFYFSSSNAPCLCSSNSHPLRKRSHLLSLTWQAG